MAPQQSAATTFNHPTQPTDQPMTPTPDPSEAKPTHLPKALYGCIHCYTEHTWEADDLSWSEKLDNWVCFECWDKETHGEHGIRLDKHLAAENAQLQQEVERLRRRTCTGCDSTQSDVVRFVIAGQAACCPDCSVLSVDSRNAIRELRQAAEGARFALAQSLRQWMAYHDGTFEQALDDDSLDSASHLEGRYYQSAQAALAALVAALNPKPTSSAPKP